MDSDYTLQRRLQPQLQLSCIFAFREHLGLLRPDLGALLEQKVAENGGRLLRFFLHLELYGLANLRRRFRKYFVCEALAHGLTGERGMAVFDARCDQT